LDKNITEDKTGGLFSLRVKNFYVASIGSIHPVTKKAYTIVDDVPVIPMPDDFLAWLQSQVIEKPKTREEAVQRGKYGLGTRYGALMSELGSLWNRGYDRDGLVKAGVAWARTNFDTGAEEFNEALVQKEIEHYHDTYGDGQDKSVALTQQPTPGSPAQIQQAAQTAVSEVSQPQDWGEVIPLDNILRPVLPFRETFLPKIIRRYCADVVHRMSVPMDFAGIAA